LGDDPFDILVGVRFLFKPVFILSPSKKTSLQSVGMGNFIVFWLVFDRNVVFFLAALFARRHGLFHFLWLGDRRRLSGLGLFQNQKLEDSKIKWLSTAGTLIGQPFSALRGLNGNFIS
jgi:hypothetical protein